MCWSPVPFFQDWVVLMWSDVVCGYAHVSQRRELHKRTCRRLHGCIEERRPDPFRTMREVGVGSIDLVDTINSPQNLSRRYHLPRRGSCSDLRRIPFLPSLPYLCYANHHPSHPFHSPFHPSHLPWPWPCPCPCRRHRSSSFHPGQTPSRETASTRSGLAASRLILPTLWRVWPTTRGSRG